MIDILTSICKIWKTGRPKWLQEGIWQGMTRSLMGKYNINVHIIRVIENLYDKTVQWQHRRLVQNYSWSPTRTCILTIFFKHLSRENHVWGIEDYEGSVSIGDLLITVYHYLNKRVVTSPVRIRTGKFIPYRPLYSKPSRGVSNEAGSKLCCVRGIVVNR